MYWLLVPPGYSVLLFVLRVIIPFYSVALPLAGLLLRIPIPPVLVQTLVV